MNTPLNPRVHIFQHDPRVGSGILAPWLTQIGWTVSWTRFFHNDPSPDINQIDFFILLGGSMGVYDHAEHPWLYTEKRLLESIMAQGKKILGICLGAQLIAEVLGARVYTSRTPERGWFPIELTPYATRSSLFDQIPQRFTALHWHEDAFDLPVHGHRIAGSQGCLNQGFILGSSILALQFHPEFTAEDIRIIAQEHKNESMAGTYVQPVEQIARSGEQLFTEGHLILQRIIGNYLYSPATRERHADLCNVKLDCNNTI